MRITLLIVSVLGSCSLFLLEVQGTLRTTEHHHWDLKGVTSVQIDSDGFNPPFGLTILVYTSRDSVEESNLRGTVTT